jgi:hypothetical protein
LAFRNSTTTLSKCLQLGHSKVRRSNPRRSGSIRARYIWVEHCGHRGRSYTFGLRGAYSNCGMCGSKTDTDGSATELSDAGTTPLLMRSTYSSSRGAVCRVCDLWKIGRQLRQTRTLTSEFGREGSAQSWRGHEQSASFRSLRCWSRSRYHFRARGPVMASPLDWPRIRKDRGAIFLG